MTAETAGLLPAGATEWLPTLTAGTLLGLTVLLILTGQLIPRRVYLEMVKALAKERDEWRAVAMQALGQVDGLLPAAQISAEAVRSLAAHSSAAPGSVQVEQAMQRQQQRHADAEGAS